MISTSPAAITRQAQIAPPRSCGGRVGPMAYLLITEGALAHRSVTPWIWPTRPPHDRGGAICACLVIAAGLVLITIRGPREWDRESGPAS